VDLAIVFQDQIKHINIGQFGSPVDNWLEKHESRQYDVLYVSCCNEGRVVLRPRKSMLIYPLGVHSEASLIREALKEDIADTLKIVEAQP